MYEQFVKDEVGKLRVQNLKKSDIKHFYNLLVDERDLQITTMDNIHAVLHQVLTVAVCIKS